METAAPPPRPAPPAAPGLATLRPDLQAEPRDPSARWVPDEVDPDGRGGSGVFAMEIGVSPQEL